MTDYRDSPISFPMFGAGFSVDPPYSFSIAGFPIYLYGITIAIGFALAVLYAYRHSTRFGIKPDKIPDMLLFAVPLAVICARLYYCVFEWDYYSRFPSQIINIRNGGLAIYGGVIGAVSGAFIYCKVTKTSFGDMLDTGGFGLLIGQAVGRWGNFFNREAFGRETTIFCRMGLTDPATGATTYYHPTFLYESLWNASGLLLLHILSKKFRRKFSGQWFAVYVLWYGLGRFMTEGLRTDSLYLWGTGIRISQAVAGVSVISAAAILIYKFYGAKRTRKTTVNKTENNKEEQ